MATISLNLSLTKSIPSARKNSRRVAVISFDVLDIQSRTLESVGTRTPIPAMYSANPNAYFV